MNAIGYIDPMSYNNLEIYDVSLLSNSNYNKQIYFFCSNKLKTNYIDGVIIKKIFNYNDKKFISKLFLYLLSLLKLIYYIRINKIRLLHVQWFRIPIIEFYFYKLIRLIFPKIKLIHTAHNVVPHNSTSKGNKYLRKLYILFDSIILHTDKSLNEIKLITRCTTKKKFVVIPHGILKYPYSKDDINNNFKKITFLEKICNKTVFASLGAQSYYKGIDILVDVWIETPELAKNESIFLIIAGKGKIPRIDELKKMDNVIVENKFIDDLTFVTYMSLADVVLMPYRKISQSGVLLTALSLHRAILVSDAGGLTDPLKFGNIGWIVKAGDKSSLTETLIFLTKNKSCISTINNNIDIWNKVVLNYDWNEIKKKTFSLYDSLL